MIPKDTVDAILQATIIEEVVGEFVQLKKSGTSLRGMSPFTNEKTPSFYVVPGKGSTFTLVFPQQDTTS